MHALAEQRRQGMPTGAVSVKPGDVSPPHYVTLPARAEQCAVKDVDFEECGAVDVLTLTLADGRRVGLAGIDTSQLKLNQPVADKAVGYAKRRCCHDVAYLKFEPSEDGNGADRPGHLKAQVWVKEMGGSVLCVNEGLVEAGYASVCRSGKSQTTCNRTTLVFLQQQARRARLGIHGDDPRRRER